MRTGVNDFSIHVATVNGSGSQTANNVLLRAIFQMGIPVSGKNLFPSNIAGLPTWFTIRASKDGWIARRGGHEILVVMNPETAAADVAEMGPGTVIVTNESIKLPPVADDRIVYAVPMAKLMEPITTDVKLRRLVVNMIYVGVLAELLGIDVVEVDKALHAQLGRKPKAMALNQAAVQAGMKYVREHLPKRDPYKVERLSLTAGKILIDGNTAAALGAMFAGVTVVTWYPITPSSSLVEALIGFLEKYRRDPATGKASYAVIQAEDEIAAIGMVLGAGWAGARSMTSTSGPGLSHGDTQFPVLLPGSVSECYEFAQGAFDLAERLQMPVFVLSDLDLGMNNWMSEPFTYPDKAWDRGKVLDDAALAKLAKFERYRDVDGDGIPYRTLPGSKDWKGTYFTRGSGHDEAARYTEDPNAYVRNMDRLKRKLETARTLVPVPEVFSTNGAEIGLIAYGSSHWALVEARAELAASGVRTSYMRVRGMPLPASVAEFVKQHDRVYVIEQNRDGQLTERIRLESPDRATRIRSVLHYDGLPLDARSVVRGVLAHEGVAQGVVK